MDTKKRSSVAVKEFHSGIQGNHDIAAAREGFARAIVFEKPFLLNHIAFLPRLLPLPALAAGAGSGVIGRDLPGSGLERAGEARGGGLAGVVADGGVRRGAGIIRFALSPLVTDDERKE
nr:hypothetical protein Iba_chr01eCG3540 [Ipomoea batatas]GMC55047.1 hypothetical protein Iba_chr01eCG3740 [Ipomoea batatas]